MTPLRSIFFGHFLLRLSGNKCSQVLSIGKFGPTAPDFGYDFPLYFLLYIVNMWVCCLHMEASITNTAAAVGPNFPIDRTWEHLFPLSLSKKWPNKYVLQEGYFQAGISCLWRGVFGIWLVTCQTPQQHLNCPYATYKVSMSWFIYIIDYYA